MHRLALSLGKTLEEISEISPEELESWQAYYELEPFGANVQWTQFSVLASGIRGGEPADYIPASMKPSKTKTSTKANRRSK